MSFQVPVVQHFCTCTDDTYNPTQIGRRQKEYEDLRLAGYDFMEAMIKMNVKRLCCREKLLNPSFLFLRIADLDRIRDEAGHLNKKSGMSYNKVTTLLTGDPILPKKPFPEIPR